MGRFETNPEPPEVAEEAYLGLGHIEALGCNFGSQCVSGVRGSCQHER
jgi:hypothetical protein